MLFCDLTLDNVVLWSGVPCLNGVGIKSSNYIDFDGNLIFIDQQGKADPTFEGLGSRFLLLYVTTGLPNRVVPLQATPTQRLSIVLNQQNCVLSIYEKEAPYNEVVVYADDYADDYYEELT